MTSQMSTCFAWLQLRCVGGAKELMCHVVRCEMTAAQSDELFPVCVRPDYMLCLRRDSFDQLMSDLSTNRVYISTTTVTVYVCQKRELHGITVAR